MADIKINELNDSQVENLIDFKSDSVQKNAEAVTAFKSLRGGGCCRWCSVVEV